MPQSQFYNPKSLWKLQVFSVTHLGSRPDLRIAPTGSPQALQPQRPWDGPGHWPSPQVKSLKSEQALVPQETWT